MTNFRKFTALLLSLALLCGMLPLSVFTASATPENYFEATATADHDGSSEDKAYVIDDVYELEILAAEVNGEFDETSANYAKTKETYEKDTSLKVENLTTANPFTNKYFKLSEKFKNEGEGEEFTTPIGWYEYITKEISTPFAGNFNGNNKTVTLNITVDGDSAYAYIGLFGYNQGTIKNVNVTGSVFAKTSNGYAQAGGVCGYNRKGNITNCSNSGSGSISASSTMGSIAGGICGNNSGTITNCSNSGSGSISASSTMGSIAGGICGSNSGTITNCSNSGSGSISVSKGGNNSCAGGVCGSNNGNIANCSNSGSSSISLSNCNSNNGAGGICGYNESANIFNCYCSGGTVSASGINKTFAGGICGFSWGSTEFNNCYYDKETVKDKDGTPITKGIGNATQDNTGETEGLTTAEMKSEDGLLKKLNDYVTAHPTIGTDPNTITLEKWEIASNTCDIHDEKYNGYPTFESVYNKLTETKSPSVDITIQKPKVGEELATTGEITVTTDPANAINAEIKSLAWTDEEEQTAETAENNIEYTVKGDFLLSINDGYRLAKDTKITTAKINGETVELTNNSDGNYSFSYKFKLIETNTANIDLTIPAPQVEQKLAEKATVNFKTDPANALTVDAENIDWTDSNENIAKLAKCCGEYTANVHLDLAVIEGYKFTKDTAVTATVNGKKATITRDYEMGYTVSYTFNKIQHTWDDGKVVKDATTKHGAVRLFTCTACQEALRTEFLPQAEQTIKLLKKKYKAKNNTVKIKAKAKGSKLRFRALNKSKYYRVNKYGRIRFRNGAKGTYKIKVKITAKVNDSYKQATTTKVIKVKVK